MEQTVKENSITQGVIWKQLLIFFFPIPVSYTHLIAAVKQLSADVGIPADLHGILKEEDVAFLAKSAYADACCPRCV